jgi:hypothetical protein
MALGTGDGRRVAGELDGLDAGAHDLGLHHLDVLGVLRDILRQLDRELDRQLTRVGAPSGVCPDIYAEAAIEFGNLGAVDNSAPASVKLRGSAITVMRSSTHTPIRSGVDNALPGRGSRCGVDCQTEVGEGCVR